MRSGAPILQQPIAARVEAFEGEFAAGVISTVAIIPTLPIATPIARISPIAIAITKAPAIA